MHQTPKSYRQTPKHDQWHVHLGASRKSTNKLEQLCRCSEVKMVTCSKYTKHFPDFSKPYFSLTFWFWKPTLIAKGFRKNRLSYLIPCIILTTRHLNKWGLLFKLKLRTFCEYISSLQVCVFSTAIGWVFCSSKLLLLSSLANLFPVIQVTGKWNIKIHDTTQPLVVRAAVKKSNVRFWRFDSIKCLYGTLKCKYNAV